MVIFASLLRAALLWPPAHAGKASSATRIVVRVDILTPILLFGLRSWPQAVYALRADFSLPYKSPMFTLVDAGGAGENRTHDRGFADLGLTTWLPRQIVHLKRRAQTKSPCRCRASKKIGARDWD